MDVEISKGASLVAEDDAEPPGLGLSQSTRQDLDNEEDFWRRVPAYLHLTERTFLDHQWQNQNAITRVDKLALALGDLLPDAFYRDVVTDSSIKSRRAADRRADIENQWRSRINDITSVVVRDHPFARLGAVQPGDEIRIQGRPGWTEVDMWVRVLSISFQPADGNVAQYTIARTDRLQSS